MMISVVVAAVAMLAVAVHGSPGGPPTAQAEPLAPGAGWVTAWGASPVVGTDIPGNDCPAGKGLADQTVRNVIFLSTGGDAVRVRLSNTFGTQEMRIDRATVAVRANGADAVPGTVRALTFGGAPGVTMTAGGQALSDPVGLTVRPLSTVLVSVYVKDATGPVTNHPFTAQGNYLATGDQAASVSGAGYGGTPCWMFVDGVDVQAPRRVLGSVVALGDSITDTANTTGNADRRWPDDLAHRLDALHGPTLSVVNAGLGGNRVLAPRDGQPYYGVPALARLDRDVFAQTGVRSVILLEGVNDIGYDATADRLIPAYQQIIAQTHARGLRIYGGTITPFGGSFLDTPQREETRHTINAWIRTSHAFDGVVDFDKAVADPADPDRMLAAYDGGDHLHPGDAGCQAMADAVNLSMLVHGDRPG